jgi:hypothetical protein
MESVAEVWKPVKGFEGMYEVSDQGRVRSLERTIVRANGVPMRVAGGILSCSVSNDRSRGYPAVNLLGRSRLVHHLVLEAFVGPRPSGYEGCHGNGIRTDNRLANLRWDTMSGNQMDRVLHGTSNRGERCGKAKLTESQVVEILRSTERGCEIAKRFGISQQRVYNIRTRRDWAHVNP